LRLEAIKTKAVCVQLSGRVRARKSSSVLNIAHANVRLQAFDIWKTFWSSLTLLSRHSSSKLELWRRHSNEYVVGQSEPDFQRGASWRLPMVAKASEQRRAASVLRKHAMPEDETDLSFSELNGDKRRYTATEDIAATSKGPNYAERLVRREGFEPPCARMRALAARYSLAAPPQVRSLETE
jgi:hypothetical protein